MPKSTYEDLFGSLKGKKVKMTKKDFKSALENASHNLQKSIIAIILLYAREEGISIDSPKHLPYKLRMNSEGGVSWNPDDLPEECLRKIQQLVKINSN
jgi:hypothetical protein